MPRTFWLALICLLAVSVLFAVRTGIGTRRISVATASADAATASAINEEPPLAKADRLPSRYFLATPSKTTVSTIDVALTPEPEKAGPTAGASGQRINGAIPQAPIGHRQPTASEVPDEKNLMNANDAMSKEDAALDKKIKSICRGC